MLRAQDLMIVELPACAQSEEAPLAPLERHAWRLMEVLSDPAVGGSLDGDAGPWDQTAEWLRLAAGLQEVVVDSARYDSSVMMCEGAHAFEAERSEQLIAVSTELTRIVYLWNAVERMRAAMRPPGKGGPGVVLVDYLEAHARGEHLPAHYVCAIRALRSAAEGDPVLQQAARPLQRACDDDPTIGLRTTTKVRNGLLHGLVRLPPAGAANEMIVRRVQVAKLTARVALFSMQMLARIYHEDDPGLVWDEELAADTPIAQVLAKAHLDI